MCVYGPHDLVPNDIFLIKFILMVQMSFFLYLVSFMIVDSGMIYDWKMWQPQKIWCRKKKKKKPQSTSMRTSSDASWNYLANFLNEIEI